MKTIGIPLAVAVLAVALTACADATNSGDTAGSPAGAAAAPGDRTGDQAAVETAFRDYNQALGARDFAKVCALSVPETVTALAQKAGSCEQGFSQILADPGAAVVVGGAATSMQIVGVTVTGDDAKVMFSAEIAGRRQTTTSGLRRIDGRWRLLNAR